MTARRAYRDSDALECRRCKSALPLAAFHRNKARPRGVSDWCKACCADRSLSTVSGVPSPFDECPADAMWRPLPRLPEFEVSEYGHLRRQSRQPSRVLRPELNAGGYAVYRTLVLRCRVTLPAHRIVLEAFHGEPTPSERHASHLNGDRLDDRPSNLRWTSAAGNHEDARQAGRIPLGSRCGHSKLTEGDVRLIRAAPGPHSQIARNFGVSNATVDHIRSGRKWRHVI